MLWEVVDTTLRDDREQFSSDLGQYWDARRIYQAQADLLQVRCLPKIGNQFNSVEPEDTRDSIVFSDIACESPSTSEASSRDW